MSTLHQFIINLKPKHRKEMLEGRPHLVCDASIIGNDVIMEGSEGAYLYPSDENEKSVTMWNGMPVVVYHPEMNGEYITARDPEVWDARKVGLLFNTKHGDKLKTEAWVDEERVKAVSKKVYNAILKDEPMEISVGLGAEVIDGPGEKDGKKYLGVVGNYKPDHLAILPDRQGAFSVAMGGGLLVNRKFSQKERASLAASDFGDPKKKAFPVLTQEDLNNAVRLVGHADDPAAVKRKLISIAKRKGLKLPDTWVSNEASFNDTERQLCTLLATTFGEKGVPWSGWLVDVFPSYCVYGMDGDYYKVGYKLTNDKVELTGDPVEVVRTTDYQPVVANSSGAEESEMANAKFDKKAHITSLIGNGWEESDREVLEAMDDKVLAKIKPEKKEPAPDPKKKVKPANEVIVNEDDDDEEEIDEEEDETPPKKKKKKIANTVKELDEETYLKTLPPAFRKRYQRLAANEAKEKEALVKAILNHENNVMTEDFLNEKDNDELKAILALAGPSESDEDGEGDPRFAPGFNRGDDFGGRQSYVGVNGTMVNHAAPADLKPLGLPDYEAFEKSRNS